MDKLCIHTITNKPLDFKTLLEKYAKRSVAGVSIWTDVLEKHTPRESRQMCKDYGIKPVALVRGGFFPSTSKETRKEAIETNKKLIHTAAELGTEMIVLVCGSSPDQGIQKSIGQIKDGLVEVLPLAEELNIKLAIEPLHPMYADTRSAITTMKQTNDIIQEIDSEMLGAAIDVYHVWWDTELEKEIHRCGRMNKIFGYHICDWKVPTNHFLTDRGLMGEGCIDIKSITNMVEEAGFNGFREVEIFSTEYWQMNQDDYLDKIVKSYRGLYKNKI